MVMASQHASVRNRGTPVKLNQNDVIQPISQDRGECLFMVLVQRTIARLVIKRCLFSARLVMKRSVQRYKKLKSSKIQTDRTLLKFYNRHENQNSQK